MGRNAISFVQDNFNKLPPAGDGSKEKAECIHCKVKQAWNATRLLGHLGRCKVFKETQDPKVYHSFLVANKLISTRSSPRLKLKRECSTYSSPTGSASKRLFSEASPELVGVTQSKEVATKRRKTLRDFTSVDSCSKERAEEISFAAAKFAHIHASSFDHFNNEEGQELFRTLNSAAPSPPTREHIGGKFLIRHNNDVLLRVEQEMLRRTGLSITTDGWKDEADGQRLHNLMVCFPLPFLLENELDKGTGETKYDLLKMAERMIYTVIKVYTVQNVAPPMIIGFCTDNPNSNKGMRVLIEKSEELKVRSSTLRMWLSFSKQPRKGAMQVWQNRFYS